MPLTPTQIKNANIDLRIKLSFERSLSTVLVVLFNKMMREVHKEFLNSGDILDFVIFKKTLETILFNHNEKVSNKFINRVTRNQFDLTNKEQESLLISLKNDSSKRAKVASKLIITNLNKDIQNISNDNTNILDIIVAMKRRALFRFRDLTPVNETQDSSEGTKLRTAQYLQQSINNINLKELLNAWATVGDDVVRPAHVEAEGQTKPISKPFIVMGERLMRPRDTSLGATAENTQGCRCSAQYFLR